ncbi:hypothetical protein NQD34_011252 [Periophthalmus magnuspinnatus]|nr:hypothetical protein NQD34_011252 [Periophthalmus magnuspinnatus]
MASVRVAVRVRPLEKRGKNVSSKVVVEVKADNVTIYKPIALSNHGEESKTFSFDFSYDSTDPNSSSFASQEKIYKDLGSGVIKAASEGFNTCILAYGQTGSGKSYTMMGQKGDKGLIPRICEGLFQQIAEKSKSAVSFHTEVSFLEIYNERVQDLLQKNSTPTDKGPLKVREHPKEGPYVQNLTRHLVQSYSDVEELMLLGNSNRTTAITDLNDASSRSHAIFTIRFTRAWFEDSLPCETVSKIHLVDLAGSERADATRATGARLKEGANINKSLVTLGCVISTLVLFQNVVTTKRKKMIFIPYRDSVLTWLLKDSLGGNSKTTMIATISPAEANYTETLSTLHYANRAKSIVNSPKVNEDNSVKVIRALQAEIERLRKLLEEASQLPLAQVKELHVGFAGHTLSLLGPTEERVLGLYTYSQSLTRELCGAVFRLLCPLDRSVCEHPLLRADLMDMSLKWQALVPDLLLDTGLRVLCHFQRSLADLIYLLHCNTILEGRILGEVRLCFYCCVGIWFPSKRRLVGQLFVTGTHIGLVQEDIVFPPFQSVPPEPSRLHFHSLSVRRLGDVRGVVVHEEDSRGAVTVDVILANVKARGHPERETGCAHPSSHAQVWKLTLSCSAEAARLINHLSNV